MSPINKFAAATATAITLCTLGAALPAMATFNPRGAPAPPVLDCNRTLIVRESRNSFNRHKLRCKHGTVKITVKVPKTAKSKHGVAIDGGEYQDVEGQPVKPGRYTSLTVHLKRGSYTVYDPVGNNRDIGYTVKLTVK